MEDDKFVPDELKLHKEKFTMMGKFSFDDIVPEEEMRAFIAFMDGPPPPTIFGMKPYIPDDSPVKPFKLPRLYD